MTQLAPLSEIGSAYARAVTEDLRGLIGVEVAVRGPTSVDVKDGAVLRRASGPIGHTRCASRQDAADVFHITTGRAEAATLASILMGQVEGRIAELRKEALDEETLDAYGEVMNLSNAVLSRVLNERFDLPTVAIEKTDEIEAPQDDDGWLEGDRFLVAHYTVVIPGWEDGSLDLIFPLDLAARWFTEGAAAVEGVVEDAGLEEPTSVVVIDAITEDREAIEDLEEEIGHSIWAIDPDDFDPSDLEEFLEAGAFVVDWELGVRGGADLIETLRGEQVFRDVPIVAVSARPTEAKVRAALAVGASTFCRKPYSAEEIKSRLNPLLAARARALQEDAA